MKTETADNYVHGMDWGQGEADLSTLSNYRKYQYDLVGKYMGRNVLEVGSGDRGFTRQIVEAKPDLKRIISIEPSDTLLNLFKGKSRFPDNVIFDSADLFNLTEKDYGKFDTALFIHVLEHIEHDKAALDHTHSLLEDGGRVLIEVPAMPWLFSVHDEMLGHYRRYNKQMLRDIIDPKKYRIIKLWYQDPIGVLGSYYFFKLKKIKLKSDQGQELFNNQGAVYDKYVIPFEKAIEKFITFPFGLSVSAIIQKI